MFKKRKCSHCGEKISKEYNFCPYCRAPKGNSFGNEDWGLLGKEDDSPEQNIGLPLGFNILFNTLLKNISSQFHEMEKDSMRENLEEKDNKPNIKKGGISISISTSGNRPPEIKVSSFGNSQKQKEQKRRIEGPVNKIKLPYLESEKFHGLPKKEPKTDIRRFSNKVIYEVNLPGVKSIKDLSLVQLENSIEIKALAKDKVFYKVIPINLPIKKYDLLKGKLVLELDSRD